jgi:hypothetical protein
MPKPREDRTYTIIVSQPQDDMYKARLVGSSGDTLASGLGVDYERAILAMAKQLNKGTLVQERSDE